MLRKWGMNLLLFLFMPVCIIGILLFINPTFLRQIAIALRFSFTIVFPLLVFLFFLAYSSPRKWGKAVAVIVTVSVYSLALLGVWASGFSDTYILSGLLPISDASGYYSNTLRFPLVGQFTEFASRRPLYNSLLTSISALTNYNFVLIQSILVLIMGIACTYAALAVRDSYGSLPAALVAVLLFFYFRRFTGFFSSETLGLGLGASGFVFLWRSAVLRSHKYYLPGLFLCSLGLITRAGAFLVLPMLVLWGAIFLGKCAKHRIWVAASGIIIIIAAFLMNTALFKLYGAPEAASFSNYAYSLYGLATGGMGWKQVVIDHPELSLLPVNEQTTAIYRLTIEAIINHPLGLISGMLSEYRAFFSQTYYSVWSFVGSYPLLGPGNNLLTKATHVALYVLCGIGIFSFLKHRNDPLSGLAVFSSVGFLISVPFAPPTHAFGLRAFAATIWVFPLLAAVGLNYLIQLLKLNRFNPIPVADNNYSISVIVFSAILVFFTLFGASLVKTISHPGIETFQCPNGSQPAYVPFNVNSYILVDREDEFFLDGVPRFHQGRFNRNLRNTPYLDLYDSLANLVAPFGIMQGITLGDTSSTLVVVDPSAIPNQNGSLYVCGEIYKNILIATSVEFTH